jgi:hypothetical protein
MQAENFGNHWLKIDLPFACEIHHCFPAGNPDTSRFRVLSHTAEPSPLKWPAEQVRIHQAHFDLIITSDESLLDLPQARFLIFGDAWTTAAPARKEFALSNLWSAGIAANWDGYLMREKIWNLRHRLKIPTHFWYSQRRPPKTLDTTDRPFPEGSKDILFESMFSVIVENLCEKNYFTEKILDALQTYTVPLYFGCPNIHDFFDPRGILTFRDEAEFFEIANHLTADHYWQRMSFVQDNFQRSLPYQSGLGRMRRVILESHASRT